MGLRSLGHRYGRLTAETGLADHRPLRGRRPRDRRLGCAETSRRDLRGRRSGYSRRRLRKRFDERGERVLGYGGWRILRGDRWLHGRQAEQ
ncbi:MAG: hypothetical protein U9Q71_09325 [Pseudomonadota bacterium]|nr:hypothetical protein [Pseudomonadota bacterium]